MPGTRDKARGQATADYGCDTVCERRRGRLPLPHAMTGMQCGTTGQQAAKSASAPSSCVSCRVALRETSVRGSDAQFNLAGPEAQRV
ncbi:conserved protein of unknown function [Paraburkholderia dioscoreae]|uniref:Uncharacterized protein n=1 Tax=Paraburkholderia dioscoreae TaxID=2604047 RepID=A0A5Q4ZD56_9BURK|nr:conserved protein of unknown function [Paraburkholderia dioscoreae]